MSLENFWSVVLYDCGPGAIEVYWVMSRPGAGSVSHCQPAAHGLVSFLSLLRAFLLQGGSVDLWIRTYELDSSNFAP